VGPVERASNWCLSAILRVPTAAGTVFFKATARLPLFVDEGRVTQGLAELYPDRVLLPIAIDSERRWMLLDDFGPVVGWDASLETRAEVLSLFGQMQVQSTDRIDELLGLGLIDRRPAWLARQHASLLRTPISLELDDTEIEQLHALAPWFSDACDRLAAGPVPNTLVHGDLHLGNVARGDRSYVFFGLMRASLIRFSTCS
jgi:Phosphotransferase enzyme family